MSAVIAFRNEPHQKFCQVVLDSGEQIMLRMDPAGLRIERMVNADGPAALLFQADADLATSIAMGLTSKDQARQGARRARRHGAEAGHVGADRGCVPRCRKSGRLKETGLEVAGYWPYIIRQE